MRYDTRLAHLIGEFENCRSRGEKELDWEYLVKTVSRSTSNEERLYILKFAELIKKMGHYTIGLEVLTACFNDENFKGNKLINVKSGRMLLDEYADKMIVCGKDITYVMNCQLRHVGRTTPIPMRLRKVLKRKLEELPDLFLITGVRKAERVTLADCIKLLHPSEKRHEESTGSKNSYKAFIQGDYSPLPLVYTNPHRDDYISVIVDRYEDPPRIRFPYAAIDKALESWTN